MKEKSCSNCGAMFLTNELTEFDGLTLCDECLQNQTVICSHCGSRTWADDNANNGAFPLCQGCLVDHYTTCTRCDRLIHLDNAYYESDSLDEPFCYDCFQNYSSNRAIKDYYYKPTPIFYGKGGRFFGVELEVDEACEDNENSESVINIANASKEHIYCKHDGSLDDGFEIVTHPMTLNYHMDEMPWLAVVTELKEMGYLSHKANTCGLHIHVNRNSLGDTYIAQEATIARILYFFEKHWEELLKFSRRTNRQLDRWAARYGYKDRPKDILDHAKAGSGNGRYSCINLQNDNTIEFRMFRGTLKYNTIIATLQLVNRVCDVAFAMSDGELKEMSWTTFVSGCTEPELIQYLKERNIYINEPIDTEEDV